MVEICTLSLHDALPICREQEAFLRDLDDELPNVRAAARWAGERQPAVVAKIVVDLYQYWFARGLLRDRKSTRLNSSHTVTSYAVFCLKKKNNKTVGMVD